MSASKKDVLLDQLAACHNDLSWFPTFLDFSNCPESKRLSWRLALVGRHLKSLYP
jgi:hypothetical protein